jgi:hypothetical protein
MHALKNQSSSRATRNTQHLAMALCSSESISQVQISGDRMTLLTFGLFFLTWTSLGGSWNSTLGFVNAFSQGSYPGSTILHNRHRSTTITEKIQATINNSLGPHRTFQSVQLRSSIPSDVEDDDVWMEAVESGKEREQLKTTLYKLGASYDRGFGATGRARDEADQVIDALEALNPMTFAAEGIEGVGSASSPLTGAWRMIWTTAQDVLTLASSPISTVSAIYQVFDPPVVTNVIDLIPRIQALLPPGVAPQSLVRAQVTTRASPRSSMPNRVGLDFESVNLQPVQLFGFESSMLPPFGFNLPRLPDIPGSDPESSPGFFDVTYLDAELLVIRQNAPGGYFALVKVDNYDP